MANFPETRISLILRLGQAADVQAWQEFTDVYAPTLYRLALRKGLQPADAEDVTQEILFGVARAVERFQPDASRARFRTWLSRIARNLLADFCTGRAKRPISQALSDSWLEHACQAPKMPLEMDAPFEQEYRTALFRLAARRIRQRVAQTTWQAFEATAIDGQPAEEVAERLGLSLGGLYVARCRVLKMLRIEVQELERAQCGDHDPVEGRQS